MKMITVLYQVRQILLSVIVCVMVLSGCSSNSPSSSLSSSGRSSEGQASLFPTGFEEVGGNLYPGTEIWDVSIKDSPSKMYTILDPSVKEDGKRIMKIQYATSKQIEYLDRDALLESEAVRSGMIAVKK
jgi:hypothetical protein